jgi:NAD+ diphosphatase
MVSCLAGFMEPGETVEAAVRRETFEEAGIGVGRIAYVASEPWPFPMSLMIGVRAEALDEAIRIDEVELEMCRWFDRAELARLFDGTHPEGLTAPPSIAIAHHLMRGFLENSET